MPVRPRADLGDATTHPIPSARRLGLPQQIKSWSLTSLQHRLMKTGGRLPEPLPPPKQDRLRGFGEAQDISNEG
jgi:hypothetical protein